ncbi:MAG: hypothetical protein K6C13_16265 [Oscillospiraceae bacterium]|nr:hypothetical protein [Oscillospiraceae bacterium]
MHNKSKQSSPAADRDRRKGPCPADMTPKQKAADTVRTVLRWFFMTIFLFVYWLAILLLASLFLMNVWKVTMTQLIIYSCVLGGISSLVYAVILIRRRTR